MQLFISDLHLSAARPAITAHFLRFLAGPASAATSLYILGDLFEAWLGDDLIAPEYQPVISALARLTTGGTQCYVQHGNRDFLLGEGFTVATGCRLLPESHLLELCGRRTLLLHGDTLCSDDIPYQQMRSLLRSPVWIADFLAKPAQERIAFARSLREKSQEEVAGKAYAIMDVNRDTLRATCTQMSAEWVIHGHTHRPAIHQEEGRSRFVLGDWSDSGGWVLGCDESECRLTHYP